MSYTEFKKSAQNHLSDWIRMMNPGIQEGKYRYNNESVPHGHILPLKGNRSRKDAIIEAIADYKVLTDNVTFREDVFPKSELHILANHLTSSQILCYNFFRLFIPEELCCNRMMPVTLQLRQLLAKSFPEIPQMSENGVCQFEYKIDDEFNEGTSFDFCMKDGKTTVLFEIKYTESGFGKAPDDERHKNKFRDVYSKLLNRQDTVCKDIEREQFLNNYQLFRNALRTSENVYAVVIYPKNNITCENEFKRFTSNNNWINHSERIKSIYWETALSNSILSENSELRRKYNL